MKYQYIGVFIPNEEIYEKVLQVKPYEFAILKIVD